MEFGGGRTRRFSFLIKFLIHQHPSQFTFPKYVSSIYTVLVFKDSSLRPYKEVK